MSVCRGDNWQGDNVSVDKVLSAFEAVQAETDRLAVRQAKGTGLGLGLGFECWGGDPFRAVGERICSMLAITSVMFVSTSSASTFFFS